MQSCNWSPNCDQLRVSYANKNWIFPSTIGEAEEKHGLAFKQPAYYYTTDSTNLEVVVCFHNKSGDYDDDRQQKETLYPRDVHTYLFQFKAGQNTYDSLKLDLEKKYQKRFVLTKGLKTWNIFIEEKNRPFEQNLLIVNECLAFGISNGKSERFGKVVNVHMMYGLSLGDIGVQAGGW
ncbi:hypothetical protein [Dyadobacter arcticus]|uniref:Uncharacterized protein n=1 Tax=Dyadobacter arcticus TaxID=1078754 RepID=A0ABX0UF84_9BACT|nr:hypothetical protein [Dyadobacter arcticus]NIJ51664.1 hypothetical protein [Dyadobacter arcticus]